MCGIVGMLLGGGLGDADRAEVQALTDLMVARGPDDAGSWDDGDACALGFRRLSIIDLSAAGHQPMRSADGSHVLVFNGELYNYRELRSELASRGRTFRSASDSEVVLQALEEWGEAALARFNGMFALACYRPAARELLLARDPLGIKPLWWWHDGGAFVFGSQYDQVIRHRRCDRSRFDPGTLGIYLRLGYLPAPYGLLERTGQVEPGTWLKVRAGEPPRRGTFRALPEAPPVGDRLRGAAAVVAVAEAVATAVERQLVADVPVGVFLSGGVDSPLVAATMAGAAPSTPAFSIGTDDVVTDEADVAAAYAAHLGLEHHLRRIDAPTALGLLDEVVAANTEPAGDYSSFPTSLVSSLAVEHVKVVLSGDGGDELFWGYPRFAKVRGARRWFHLPRPVRYGAYAATKPAPVAKRPARGVRFSSLGEWYLDAHSGLRDHDLAAFAPDLLDLPTSFDLFELSGVPSDDDLLQWMRRNELRCHLPMVLQKVDRASMHESLEVRVPLLDLEVVELSARIDPSACLDGAVGKGVLRRALASHVPSEAIPVAKRGFTVPLGAWLRHDLRGLVEDVLLDRDGIPPGAFDRAALRGWYEQHRAGSADHTRGLWNLLALRLWADRHLQPLPAGPTGP